MTPDKAAPLTDQQRFLLGECVQAYLPLDATQAQEFKRLIATEPYQGVQAMNTTWYARGIEEGIEKGREEGIEKGREEGIEKGRLEERRTVLRDLLEEKFGPLSAEVQQRLQQLSAERLQVLTKAVLRAPSLRDLGLED